MMPSFIGSLEEAVKEGQTTGNCAHCGCWIWIMPEDRDRTGRHWCGSRACERKEAETKFAERGAPETRIGKYNGVEAVFIVDGTLEVWACSEAGAIGEVCKWDSKRIDTETHTAILKVKS
jgi:hypothetical protein